MKRPTVVDVGTCTDSFLLLKGQLSASAMSHIANRSNVQPTLDAKTVSDCKARCLGDNNCAGFNWSDSNNNSPRCLLYRWAVGATAQATGYDLYIRES